MKSDGVNKVNFLTFMGGLTYIFLIKKIIFSVFEICKKIKSNTFTKVNFLKLTKKKFFQKKSGPKKIFDTRVVEKIFFDIVSLYTKKYAVIYALFIIFMYKILINVYV